MELELDLSRGPLAAEAYRQLRDAILDGRLRPGDAVPASRELAERLGVSRNTISNAYARLTSEGFLEGRVGAGTFVTAAATSVPQARRAPRGAVAPLPVWRGIGDEVSRDPPSTARYQFRIGVPDPTLFPWADWRRLVARQLRESRVADLGYGDPAGLPALRAAIARHVGLARGVVAGSDDVIVTAGAQQALDLCARVLVEPGVCVAVEDPGYPPARAVFRAAGARIVPVPVDDEGLEVARLPDDARIVYVTPSHQFPLGVAMSLARRAALLAWAEARAAIVVEDDYDSEYRYSTRPLQPLQSLDRAGRVVYIGTFSKVLAPALRIGFAIAPASLVPALVAARALADSHGPIAYQAALAAFIDRGLLARHVRRTLSIYRERREALLAALARHSELEVVRSSAGLHVAAFGAAASTSSVLAPQLAPYYQRRARPGVLFGLGSIAAKDIDAAVRALRTR